MEAPDHHDHRDHHDHHDSTTAVTDDESGPAQPAADDALLSRTLIAERIRPDIEELLRIEIQTKKLRGQIKDQLKALAARKKVLSKRVEECMTAHKFNKVRGSDGVISLVTREVPVRLDSVALAERLAEVLRDEHEAARLAARVFEEQGVTERRALRVKPERAAASDDDELDLHGQ